MKTKTSLIAAIGLVASASALHATVTIAFNAPFLGGMSSNLANKGGVVTNGMYWGLFVDGGNDGIVDTGYSPITPSFSSAVNLVNASTTLTSNDWLYFAQDFTSDSSQGGALTESDFVTAGGNGGVSSIVLTLVNPAVAGKAFSLFWLDPSGSVAGLLSDPSFILPPDGQDVAFDAPFLGVDPIRDAGFAYTGTSGASTGSGLTFVPEPSAALLGAIGVLGLLRRRRA